MLDYREYIADWSDMPYPNFIAWLDGIEAKWADNTAVYYRSGKQKDFTVWTYAKLAEEVRRVSRGLLAAGLVKGDRVGLWSENRPEWMSVWLGAAVAGLVVVPIDFLVSEQECLNILRITKAAGFFYSGKKQSFADALPEQGIALKVSAPLNPDSFGDFGGAAQDQPLPQADSIAERDPVSIVFTSGTTGFAKGVVLHHKGIIANVNAAIMSLRGVSSDVFINVLPLHHTYPTTCSFLAPLSLGASTIIVERLVGDVVVRDIKDAGGTFLIAVPLLYDKVMNAIDQKYQQLPEVLRKLLDILRRVSLAEANKGRIGFGRAAFRFVRKRAGLDSIRIMVAGGGPLNPKTGDFFDSFGFNIVHGYGMSENSPLISVNTPRHKNNRSVGLPVKYTEVAIIEKDDDGIGEIAVKSPSVMLGYYENPEATAEMFTEDGYLRTGDLGYRDEQGFIFISGRKKNLIVSSGGKNIYPEEIEACFEGSRVAGETLILGRKEQDYGGERIVAVIVPNFEALAQDYPEKQISAPDDPFLRDLIKKEIEKINRALPAYKKISDFAVRLAPFEKNAQQKIRRFLYKDFFLSSKSE
ncbi:MAG: AMP-binding protein [Spirochaetaceae bacterium]|jgi:long-chain acyl-CoA synthetase|nr:AMP-binding protein [Spirochaetaceae bacterium]